MSVNPWIAGFAVAMFAAVSRTSFGDAPPGEMRYDIVLLAEDPTPDSAAGTSKSAIVDEAPGSVVAGATSLHAQAWADFRRGVADAAAPDCIDPGAVAHQTFIVEGLLRIPFLARAAADGSCR
jgi:hypothetical protein